MPEEIVSKQSWSDSALRVTYNAKWLTENLDYPTILNNFRYIFDQFDRCWRSNLVSVASNMGTLERHLGAKGARDYEKGAVFSQIENLTTLQIKGYYDILKSRGIQLEDVFKWFFETYLPQEFKAEGFRFHPPTEGGTLVEKCRTIASEMDGILKQLCMYVQDGEVDRELFEMSSEHIVFSTLPGLIKEKYAYGDSEDIAREQFLLFSDQSLLSYTERTQSQYTRFYDLIVHENIYLLDFHAFQRRDLQWLIGRGTVTETPDGKLELDRVHAFILADIYKHDVICPKYYDVLLQAEVQNFQKSGDLRCAGGLFSEPEQKYLNYMLNKAAYSNGLDLRNKYEHSTYPEDEHTQLRDYLQLLKVMVLVITKINEEFCLKTEGA